MSNWFEAFRLHRRKEVVKLRDDLMAAMRYGVMMLREAVVDPAEFKRARRQGGAERSAGGVPVRGRAPAARSRNQGRY